MYLKFIAGLVALGFSFRLLLVVIGIPLALLQAAFAQHTRGRAHIWSLAANQVVLSFLYSVFLAVVSVVYGSQKGIAHRWVYALSGFFFVFFTLSSNAAEKAREEDGNLLWQRDLRQAAALGAGIGFLVGLVAFPIAYQWPEVVGLVPGAPAFFRLCFGLATWLTDFRFVNVILLVIAGIYIVNVGYMAFLGGLVLIYGLWTGLKARSAAKTPNGSGTSHHIDRRQQVPGEDAQEDAPDAVQVPWRDARGELVHKPFTAALVTRAEDFEEEVERELGSVVGRRQPTESAKALKDIVASGAVVVTFRITTEAARAANSTAIFLPGAPLPTYASAVVAYSCFVLACLHGHVKQEGIDLEFRDLVIKTTNLFFFSFPDEERANNAFAGATAFQKLMGADGEELKKWYDDLARHVALYIVQRTTSDPELKKLNLVPLLGNLLLRLVRAME